MKTKTCFQSFPEELRRQEENEKQKYEESKGDGEKGDERDAHLHFHYFLRREKKLR